MKEQNPNLNESDDEPETEFEFSINAGALADSTTADEIFPLFNRSLLVSAPDPDPDPIDLRSESVSSTSSSASLDVAGSYCAWTPPSPAGACKKSSSTGSGSGSVPGSASSSKRWKMRDLVGGKRSHSDGKEKLGFLSGLDPGKSSTGSGSGSDGKKGVREMDLVTVHRLFYGKEKGGEKGGAKRSLLPKPELVGLFANSRAHHYHPFDL